MQTNAGGCPICFSLYNREENKPCVGLCGHSQCSACLDTVLDEKNPIYICPFCKREDSFSAKIINYALLDLIEACFTLLNENDAFLEEPSSSEENKNNDAKMLARDFNMRINLRRNTLPLIICNEKVPVFVNNEICILHCRKYVVEKVSDFSQQNIGRKNQISVFSDNDKLYMADSKRKKLEVFDMTNRKLQIAGPSPPVWRTRASIAYFEEMIFYISHRDMAIGDASDYAGRVDVLVNGTWQLGPTLGRSIGFIGFIYPIVCNGKLYIIETYSSQKILVLSEDKLSWEEVGRTDGLRVNMATAALDGKIYMTGGFNYQDEKSCMCFDPEASSPERRLYPIADMIYKRYNHTLVAANGRLYAIGGKLLPRNAEAECSYTTHKTLNSGTNTDARNAKEIEEYDPNRDEWRVVGTYTGLDDSNDEEEMGMSIEEECEYFYCLKHRTWERLPNRVPKSKNWPCIAVEFRRIRRPRTVNYVNPSNSWNYSNNYLSLVKTIASKEISLPP